ncbi:MAG: protein-L-isoaspartate(D-aspartate) O-methyltransferase [Nitrospirota bacterium]|nr:protein-L-isoaspartate(D-aspartate) O-methyltransferase [Nitrospirota bacterium]MDH5767593.1 protein-L-isoaspartate(D-aspartate) O-methyltransferase [Nitrospirota bacterium]
MGFQELREFMVNIQLILRGIKDKRVLNAMRKVPRHLFIDESLQYKAYDDMALPIGEGQTISQPYMVAVMTELLELKGNEKVLEIGTGSGYQGAILAELSREVYTIERVDVLAQKAEERFRSLGYTNIHVKAGDGTLGWPEEAPFDRIMITAAAPKIPDVLMEQLSEEGIIIAPVGERFSQQLLKCTKSKGKYSDEYHTPCIFVPLIGEYGW